jgi:hypothetical protein
MSLLRQDVRLPESSIHDFGRDMVVALQVRWHLARCGGDGELAMCSLASGEAVGLCRQQCMAQRVDDMQCQGP